MKNNLPIWFIVLAALSAVCAVYGLGSSFDSLITPRSNYGHLDRVSGDGWIEDGAEIRFNDLASRGNRINIQFTAWRPAGVAPNTIWIELCRKKIDEFVLSADLERLIYLSGDCEPRAVVIHGVNSFHGSATDRRNLIAQIKSVQLSSRLGVPIPQFSWLAFTFLLILGTSFLVLLALELPILYPLSLLIAPFAAYLLQLSPQGDYRNVLAAGMCLSMLAAGIALARKIRDNSNQTSTLAPRLVRVEFIALAIVIGFGTALRFYGIDFGLPANFHPDEVPKVNAIMRMVEYGDLNPRYFLHPSFLLYCTYFTNKLLQLFGIGWEFRDSAFLAGRIVSALAGSLSLVLLFAIGRRLFGTWSGIMAAAFLAVFPLHVTCSRYLKEDSLLVFVILATTICVIKAAQEDRKWLLLVAGFLAGVSAGTKYSGMLSGAIVATAPWIRSKKIIPDFEYILWTCGAICLMPLGFLSTTPYAIGDFEKFSKDFGSESRHMSRGHTTTVTAWSQFWMYHFGRSLREGMTTLTLLVATLSAGFLARRARIQDWFVVCLILLFYLPAEYVKAKPAPQPERYIVPCLPFFALAAAEFIASLRRLGSWPRAMGLLLGLSILALPMNRSIELAKEIVPDTRTILQQWMIANIPHGSKIYMDWKPYAPRFFHGEFEVTYIPRSDIVDLLDINFLKKSGQDYLILSGLFYDRYFKEPNSPAGIRQRFRELYDRVPIVKEVRPKYGTYGFHNPALTLFSLKEQDFAKLDEQENVKFRWSIK